MTPKLMLKGILIASPSHTLYRKLLKAKIVNALRASKDHIKSNFFSAFFIQSKSRLPWASVTALHNGDIIMEKTISKTLNNLYAILYSVTCVEEKLLLIKILVV